jgi:flavin reductase (DIM6/NTAB) family NADH-FMN oxidoreductase RutF
MDVQSMLSITPADLEPPDAYRLLISTVTPRPIAWVSSMGVDGSYNLAPFSFFNAVAGSPPTLMISIGQRRGGLKDTLRNIQETKEFVVNIVSDELLQAMNASSAELDYAVDEFEVAGLKKAASIDVRPPRVAAAQAAMECVLSQVIPIPDSTYTMVLGRILRYHIREGLLRPRGLVDDSLLRPLGRLGGDEYVRFGEVITLPRPKA